MIDLVEAEVAAQLQRELVLLVEAEEGVEVEAEQLVPAPAAGPRHPGVLEHQDINISRQQSQSGWGWAGRKGKHLCCWNMHRQHFTFTDFIFHLLCLTCKALCLTHHYFGFCSSDIRVCVNNKRCPRGGRRSLFHI